jgi:hypothetical protein
MWKMLNGDQWQVKQRRRHRTGVEPKQSKCGRIGECTFKSEHSAGCAGTDRAQHLIDWNQEGKDIAQTTGGRFDGSASLPSCTWNLRIMVLARMRGVVHDPHIVVESWLTNEFTHLFVFRAGDFFCRSETATGANSFSGYQTHLSCCGRQGTLPQELTLGLTDPTNVHHNSPLMRDNNSEVGLSGRCGWSAMWT